MLDNIRKYIEVLAALRKDGILTDKKDFTCHIGEWLVAQLYNGERAASNIQQGWDVKVGDEFWQVKTHAKSEGNKARFSSIKKEPGVRVDVVVIIVFTHDYRLKEFYKIPFAVAQQRIKKSGGREKLSWNSVKEFRVEIGELPKQEVLGWFVM